MTDASATEPSEEQLRAYLESVRRAQPAEIVIQAFSILATAAEVKLGQRDARVLIDGMSGLVEPIGDRLPGEIAQRMRTTVSELQMGQVQAEREQAAGSAQEQQAAQQQAGQEGPKATDRLWIPGRD